MDMILGDATVVAPGVYDALTARLAEAAGFNVVYMSGAGLSYSRLGNPDLGLVTLSEAVQAASQIVDVVEVPVIADADTGYGNALNVERTVREFIRAGVAAIQLEDQIFPKRCGHLSGKGLVSAEEMCGKIRIACETRGDNDLMLIARTDARDVLGLDEALRRAEQYLASGADTLFIESPGSIQELEIVARSFMGVPLVANMVEGGRTPILSADNLADLGFKIILFPNSLTRYYSKVGLEFLQALKNEGGSGSFTSRMLTLGELNELLGISQFEVWQQNYIPG